MIRTGFLAAALRDGLGAFHHKRTTEFAEGTSWLSFDRILAVRIVGAGVEKSETPFPFDHIAFCADRTPDTA